MASIFSVNAKEFCSDKIIPKTECLMITPTITYCQNFTYKIYDNNNALYEEGNLILFNESMYKFNFTANTGSYQILLCDDTTRTVFVGETSGEKYVKNENYEVFSWLNIGFIGITLILFFVYVFDMFNLVNKE